MSLYARTRRLRLDCASAVLHDYERECRFDVHDIIIHVMYMIVLYKL